MASLVARRAVASGRQVWALCLVELEKLRHDRKELYTRAVQPALWLLVFGQTFSPLHTIPTRGVPYLDNLAPGILAQSALFISILNGIQIIWERDAGVRALIQGAVVLVLAAILGVALTVNALRPLGVAVVVLLSAAFISTLSIVLAAVVLSRDRLMGLGQAIMMPLFFASNALYPVAIMPSWVRAFSHVNPLSYEVEALRGLLLGSPAGLLTDLAVLVVAASLVIAVASALLARLTR